ncbi:pimeloyl-ACP methyl ester esterase BioH [Luteimonas sp. Y-2-2-4F]|nr:pimeloyl-ACP methyl ester esterase BioH [Luteimonas sp. Y-2-2-4F]MCD9032458.1 pimeloyl-ACP methyl ester esterase BioH [Luteimonas sp. Y-2-2-4F]
MHVETVGQGPDLVLLHGWAMHGGVFAPLVEALRADHTLHLVDLPGHGHSRGSALPLALAPVADALAARLPRALWLGWSLGGLFALQAAAAHPGRVRGLAMLAASPRFVHDGDWPHGMAPQVFRDFARGLREDYRGTLDRFVALEAFGSDAARDEMRTLRAALFARGEPAPRVLADGLDLLERGDLRAALPTLAMPSLWLGGRRDRLVDPRALQAAAALAPRTRAEVLAHAGHAPFLTHAAEVAAALRAFEAALPDAGGAA